MTDFIKIELETIILLINNFLKIVLFLLIKTLYIRAQKYAF